MATCRTAAIAADADPVDRREAGLLEKESGSFLGSSCGFDGFVGSSCGSGRCHGFVFGSGSF